MTRSINETPHGKVQQVMRRLTQAGLDEDDIDALLANRAMQDGMLAILRCARHLRPRTVELTDGWLRVLPAVDVRGVFRHSDQSKTHRPVIDRSQYQVRYYAEEAAHEPVIEIRSLTTREWRHFIPGWEAKLTLALPQKKVVIRRVRSGRGHAIQIFPFWEATFEEGDTFTLRYNPHI